MDLEYIPQKDTLDKSVGVFFVSNGQTFILFFLTLLLDSIRVK